jgi:hypothetical protein
VAGRQSDVYYLSSPRRSRDEISTALVPKDAGKSLRLVNELVEAQSQICVNLRASAVGLLSPYLFAVESRLCVFVIISPAHKCVQFPDGSAVLRDR